MKAERKNDKKRTVDLTGNYIKRETERWPNKNKLVLLLYDNVLLRIFEVKFLKIMLLQILRLA